MIQKPLYNFSDSGKNAPMAIINPKLKNVREISESESIPAAEKERIFKILSDKTAELYYLIGNENMGYRGSW